MMYNGNIVTFSNNCRKVPALVHEENSLIKADDS